MNARKNVNPYNRRFATFILVTSSNGVNTDSLVKDLDYVFGDDSTFVR